MRIHYFIIVFFVTLGCYAQETEIDWDAVDSLYREDHFYFNSTYNSLQKRPAGVDQPKFSYGFAIGFLRDFPLNKKRTVAIAPGLGYSYAQYSHNIGIFNENETNSYNILDNYSVNRQTLHYVDLPIEFRWRNSTFESHKFWRIYPGFKMSYLFYDHYKRESSTGTSKLFNIKDMNEMNYGVTLAVGWNTWNFYAYYGINSLFKTSAKIEDRPIDMRAAHLGLMFYIL